MFRELLIAYGCNWLKMSKLMLSKSWIQVRRKRLHKVIVQIEDYYVNNRYDLSCQRCGTSSDDAHLLLCEVCEKAFHTYCLGFVLTLQFLIFDRSSFEFSA